MAATEFLGEIAASTQGFTGADLKAMLYTAKLNSLKESLEKRKGKKYYF